MVMIEIASRIAVRILSEDFTIEQNKKRIQKGSHVMPIYFGNS